MCVGQLGMWSDVVKIYCNVACSFAFGEFCTAVAGLTSITELAVVEYMTSPGHTQGVKLLCWGQCDGHCYLQKTCVFNDMYLLSIDEDIEFGSFCGREFLL